MNKQDLRIGSLCTGYGGLDMAVTTVFGGELAWIADNDRHVAALLDVRYPDIPNLGDLTRLDWHTAESVGVITAGFPCQDISYNGRGAGIEKGARSGIWKNIVTGIRLLRPKLVVVENVAAIRRRGLDRVLGDLAELVSAFLPCLGCRGAVRRRVLVACGDAGRGCTFAGHDLVQFLPAGLGIVGCGGLPGDPRGDAGAGR